MASISRIATNVSGLNALNALNKVNKDYAQTQLRLATGQRVNSASEDAAGWVIGKGMEARAKGLSQAIANVEDSQSLLGVAEGGLQSILGILETMKEKATQAANDTLGATERNAIESQLDSLADEIDSIVAQTTFNSQALLDGTFTSKTLQVGSETTDTITVNLNSKVTAASLAVADSDLDVSSASSASTAMSKINAAITTVNNAIRDVGAISARLDFKAEALSDILTNTEAAKSTILDTDFAAEQLKSLQLQILQQTSLASLASANTAPQSVLKLF